MLMVYKRKEVERESPPLRDPSQTLDGRGGNELKGSAGTGPGQHEGSVLDRSIEWSGVMEKLSVAERYRPARLLDGKEAMIIYYAWDPAGGGVRRVKEKVNRAKDSPGWSKWCRQRVGELNAKLALGWSPFVDRQAPRAATLLPKALEAFIAAKVGDELSEDSIRSYQSQVSILQDWLEKKMLVDLAVGLFSEERAVEFMEDRMETGLSKRTFNNNKTFFGTLWNWFVRHKYARSNVFSAVDHKRVDKRKKNRRPLTDEERVLVRAWCAKHAPRFLIFSELMFNCGLRPKEVFLLRPRHVDLRRRCVDVTEEIAKTNRARTAAIPNVLMPALVALDIDKIPPEHYIFSDDYMPGNQRKSSRTSGRTWRDLRAETGLPKEAKHYSIRDTAVLQLARDGVSRVDSQNHFGHSSGEMHDVYGRQYLEEGNDEVRRKATAF